MITVAAIGDAIITRSIGHVRDSAFTDFVGVLRSADAVFANLELACPKPPFLPRVKDKGIYIAAPAHVLDDLKAIGCTMFSTANNHISDYSASGLTDTLEEIQSRGLVHAGSGRNLSEARQAAFVDSAHGRLALVAASTADAQSTLASDPDGPIDGRPGISPLRFLEYLDLEPTQFEAMKGARDLIGMSSAMGGRFVARDGATDTLSNALPGVLQIRCGSEARLRSEVYEPDLTSIIRWLRHARAQSDVVIASVHYHEVRYVDGMPCPPEHIVQASRRLVDAGAHAVVGHGPHQLMGIETYHGHPILYSLGNSFFMLETISVLPPECFENVGLASDATVSDYESGPRHRRFYGDGADKYWHGLAAVLKFEGDKWILGELWPLDLGRGRERATRGVPLLASATIGRGICDRLRSLSAPLNGLVTLEERGEYMIGAMHGSG